MNVPASPPSPAPATSQPASAVDVRDRQTIERAAEIILWLIDQGQVQYMPLLTRLGQELDKVDESKHQLEALRRRFRAAA